MAVLECIGAVLALLLVFALVALLFAASFWLFCAAGLKVRITRKLGNLN